MESLSAWSSNVDIFARLAILLGCAIGLAELGERCFRLPRLVGYMIAGVILGPGMLNWVPESLGGTLRPLMLLALGLLLFELGSRVDLGWLGNNPILIASSLCESGFTFLAVYVFLGWFGFSSATVMTIASISVATSPAVVMRIVAETNARGQLTQRLVLLTALNCLYSIVLLKVSIGIVHFDRNAGLLQAIVHPIYITGGSLVLAGLLAYFVKLVQGLRLKRDSERFTLIAALALLATSAADGLGLSASMTMLCGGMALRSLSVRLYVVPEHFGSAGAVLVIVLFTLTGVALNPNEIVTGGLISIGILLIRAVGKYFGAYVSAGYGGLSPHKAPWLGVALLPMSSLAMLQAYDISKIYQDFGGEVLSIISGAVLIMELLGPILTQAALRQTLESFPAGQRKGA